MKKPPFPEDAAAGVKEWADRFGIKLALFKAYQDGKAELPELVREVQGISPEGLILCAYPDDGYDLLEILQKVRFRPKVLSMSVGPLHPDFIRRAGRMAEGVMAPSQWEPDTRLPFPGTKEFIEKFRNEFHQEPSYHAGTAFAACQVLEKAVRGAGSLDHDKIREFIHSMDTVTVIGRFRVDQRGMQIGHNPILIQWQQGKKEIVYPTAMQTAPPRF
jgi:branched-chain amino acid transport system substrate-binding protein